MEQIFQVKKKLEKQKQLELGQAMQQLNESRQYLEEINTHLQESNIQFQANIAIGHVDQYKIKKAHERIRYYHEALLEQHRVVHEAQVKVEEAKEALKIALQDRKIFETLKEKAFEAYIENEKVEEAKRLDEIVSYKYRNS